MRVRAFSFWGRPWGMATTIAPTFEPGWYRVRLDVPRVWCGFEFWEVCARCEDAVDCNP